MKAYAWPRPPIVIAIVLANEAEKWLWIATNTYGWEMFLRWQFLAIIAFVILGAIVGIRVQRNASRIRVEEAERPAGEAAP